MAKIGDNMLGPGQGSIGNVVYYSMHGKNFVRAKPSKYNDRKSEAQLAQRARMQAVTGFLTPFRDLIRITWAAAATGRSPYHAAKSELMRNAIQGAPSDIGINYEAAMLSRGPLPLPEVVSVTLQEGKLLIEWTDNKEVADKHRHDTLVVMALETAKGTGEFKFTGVQRSAGSYLWEPAMKFPGDDKPHVWIAFRNSRETEMSDSMYVKVV